MTRDEMIQMCRDACLSEDTHCWEDCVWTMMDLTKSDESEDDIPWSKRPVETPLNEGYDG